jgi:hypothetical protein
MAARVSLAAPTRLPPGVLANGYTSHPRAGLSATVPVAGVPRLALGQQRQRRVRRPSAGGRTETTRADNRGQFLAGSEFRPFTPNTITDPMLLRHELARIRERGWTDKRFAPRAHARLARRGDVAGRGRSAAESVGGSAAGDVEDRAGAEAAVV